MFFEGKDRIYMAAPAHILGEIRPGVEVATSEWAAGHIIANEANSYIVGKFVEADKANNNKQYFRMGDLLMAQPTIAYSPLNLNHQSSPIGAFISSEMQYPKDDENNPYIEALAAMWKHYFPDQFGLVQRAYAEGHLYYSMEAVPQTLSTIGGTDDTAEYAYAGRNSDTYPTEINERSCEAIVLNAPHFVGGALIVPPAKPGWSNADIKQISRFVREQWETAERIYEGVETMAPQLDANIWEQMMGELILMSLREQAGVLKAKKLSPSKK